MAALNTQVTGTVSVDNPCVRFTYSCGQPGGMGRMCRFWGNIDSHVYVGNYAGYD